MPQSNRPLLALKEYFRSHFDEIREDFFTFLSFPSISAQPEHKESLLACLNWLKALLLKMHFSVEVWPTSGNPVLFASHLKAGKDKPTVLIYNHYDVQPVDPLEKWTTPPFEPTIRNGEVYARGAQDNKGQCWYVLQAIKALLSEKGELPVNLKLCIEGEEEIGSSGLQQIADKQREKLKADYLFIADVGIPQKETPAITLGIRGVITFTIELTGSSTDLHSGELGGIAINPLHALVDLLAKLRDSEGRITIPGFYDQVTELTQEEKAQIQFDFDAEAYKESFGLEPSGGEKQFSPLESCWVRPTCEINGISGGYSGEGFKTVIPAKATAKLSCRLVPDQDAEKIRTSVIDFLNKNLSRGVQMKIETHPGGSEATRSSPDSKIIQTTAQAYSEVFGKPCQFVLGGGSISVANKLQKASGGDLVLMGLGLPDDQIHAPNEHFGLDRLEKGFLIIARTLQMVGNF